MGKVSVNMLSIANSIKGQGVESAYNELMYLLHKYGKKDIIVSENKGLKYDVLHMHTVSPFSYLKQRFSKGKSLTYVHFLPHTLDGSLRIHKIFKNIYAWWVKRCYKKSDYLVVVNPNYVDEMVKLGCNKENIFYIPNVVSEEKFYLLKSEEKLKYRQKYGYKKDDFIVVGVGQLHKGKGVLDFYEIAKKNPEIEFIWVGGFTFGRFMEGYDEIKKIYDNPPKNLRFTGTLDRKEVNIMYNISDVFFLPSYYESFALVVLEAAHTEKPIVIRNLYTYKNIYEDNCLFGNNNDDFIEQINKLKDSSKLYNKYVKKSKTIKDKYNEEAIAKKWIKLYKTIAKK